MEPVGGDIAGHDAEFEDVRWVPIEVAHSMLTHPNERKVLAEAARALEVPA